MKYTHKTFIMAIAAGVLISSSANAETIFEAMSAAYNTNPTLHGQRATSGATNEDAALARSGFRPTIAAGASYADSHSHTTGNPTNDGYFIVECADGRCMTVNPNSLTFTDSREFFENWKSNE